MRNSASPASVTSLVSFSRLKRGTALGLVAGALLFTAEAMAADNTLPTGGSVVGGSSSAVILPNIGGYKAIQQKKQNVVINWNTFNIGTDATVQFFQPNKNAIAVNRVTTGTSPSSILGNLIANGKVVVLNKNGVLFGPNSRVDVSGLVASTGDLADQAGFLSTGELKLNNLGANPNAKIDIQNGADINVYNAGLAAFVAPTVVNNGTITANAGRIALVGGNSAVTVDLYGDGLVEFTADQLGNDAVKVENNGTLDVSSLLNDAGTVVMTTSQASALVDNVINMNGVVRANSAVKKGGKIVLGGGNSNAKVTVNGTVEANALVDNAGSVKVSGKRVDMGAASQVSAATLLGNGGDININSSGDAAYKGTLNVYGFTKGGTVETSATNAISFSDNFNITVGNGGKWTIDPTLITVDNILATNIASVLGGGSNVDLIATDDIVINAAIDWTGAGDLYVQANHDIDVNADILSHGSDVVFNVGDFTTVDATIDTGAGNFSSNATDTIISAAGKIKAAIVNLTGVNATETGGSIEAGTLTGNLSGTASLNGANKIGTLGNFNANTGLALNDIDGGLDITGAVTSNGDIAITTSFDDWSAKNLDVTSTGSVISQGGNITLTGLDKAAVDINGAVNSNGGDVTLDGRDVRFTGGTVNADVLTVNARNFVEQWGAGGITANKLQGSAGGYLDLKGSNNQIAELGNYDAGSVWTSMYGGFIKVLNAVGDLKVSGTVTSHGDDVILTTPGKLTVTGTVTGQDIVTTANQTAINNNGSLNGTTVSLNGGSVKENGNGKIVAGTLTGNLTGAADLANANNIDNLGNFTAQSLVLNDADHGLKVTGAVNTTGKVDITTANADWNDDDLDVTSTGSITTQGGNVKLTGLDKARVTVSGAIDSNGGNVTLDGRDVRLSGGSVDANTLTLTARNFIDQWGNGNVTANKLQGSAGGYLDLKGTNNNIAELGDFDAGSVWASLYGGFVKLINASGDLKVTGTVTSHGDDVTLTTPGKLTVTGTVTGQDIATTASQTAINGTGSLNGTTVSLNGGSVKENGNGKIVAGTLTGNLTGAADLGNANEINTVGNFTAQSLKLNDVSNGLKIAGAVNTTGDVDVTSTNSIWNDDDLEVTSTGSVTTQGGNVKLTGLGTARVTINGAVDSNGGDVTLDGRDVRLSGGTLDADTLTLTARNFIEQPSWTDTDITANLVQGYAGGYVSLLGSNNHIGAIGNFDVGSVLTASNGGSFKLKDASGGLDIVGDIVTYGDDVQIITPGDFAMATGAGINANGGDILLQNGGIFSTVDANSLTTSGTGTIELNQNAGGKIQNAIDAINNTGAGKNTLHVGAGTYREQVTVDGAEIANLDLLGAGRNATTIRAPKNMVSSFTANGVNYYAIVTAKNGSTLNASGFTVDGSGVNNTFDNTNALAGVAYVDADGTFTNNRIRDLVKDDGAKSGFGFLAFADGVTARTVDLTNTIFRNVQSGAAWFAGNSLSGTVQDNDIHGTQDVIASTQTGVRVSDGAAVDVIHNSIDNVDKGVVIQGSNDRTVTDNDITNVVDGIIANNAKRTAITDNRLTGNGTGTGISIVNGSNGTTVEGIAIAAPYTQTIDGFATGVEVKNSDKVNVQHNTISNVGTGVSGINTSKLDVVENEISDFADYGITLYNALLAKVRYNLIDGTTGTGIALSGDTAADSDDNVIAHNTVTLTGAGTGIAVGNAKFTTLNKNTVTSIGTGIALNGDARHTDITRNTLNGVGGVGTGLSIIGATDTDVTTNNTFTDLGLGAYVQDANKTTFDENDFYNVVNGIDALRASNLRIVNQYIDGTGAGTGIRVRQSDNAVIGAGTLAAPQGNYIQTFATGIEVANSDGVKVRHNDVIGSTDAGILVRNGADSVLVRHNDVIASGGNGIEVRNSDLANIRNNDVTNADTGIQLTGATNATVFKNEVNNSVVAAIGINGGSDNVIENNKIGKSNGSGIFAKLSDNLQILNNKFRKFIGGNAIEVRGGNTITITGNETFKGYGDNGIFVKDATTGTISNNTVSGDKTTGGILLNGTTGFTLDNNTVDGNRWGIKLVDTIDTLIQNHVINANGNHAGVVIAGTSDDTTLLNNTISNADFGLRTNGDNVGSVLLQGNTFTDNTIGAHLESGVIDLRGSNFNTFNGGDIAIQMEPNVSLALALAGDTLGRTRFNNQAQYFVQLKNGAYYAGGQSFVINGVDAFYNGFSPANSPFGRGILTLSQWQNLELQMFDLDDQAGLGQIFVGFVPGLNNEDAFPRGLGQFVGANGGFSVTIAGLPRIPGAAANAAGRIANFDASFLNRITPAAGGDTEGNSAEDMANITPAAGGDTTAEQLAAIETAAGDDSANCWSEVGGKLESGNQAVTYTFDGSMNSMLGGAACGN